MENPVHMHDFHASCFMPSAWTTNASPIAIAGRDFRLTDVFGNVQQRLFM